MIMKPKKITYQMYQVIEKFGKDIGGIILSFNWQCDRCKDLQAGQIYACNVCAVGENLCRQCYDLMGFACVPKSCFKCYDCNLIHCMKHNGYWIDTDERIHTSMSSLFNFPWGG